MFDGEMDFTVFLFIMFMYPTQTAHFSVSTPAAGCKQASCSAVIKSGTSSSKSRSAGAAITGHQGGGKGTRVARCTITADGGLALVDSTLWLTACPHCIHGAFLSLASWKRSSVLFNQLNLSWNKSSFISTKLYEQDWNFRCEHPLGHSFGNVSLNHIFGMGMSLNFPFLSQMSETGEGFQTGNDKNCVMKINIVHLHKCLPSDSWGCCPEFLKYTFW